MKKRNLFLSLVCSIILTVALVAVTIASVFVPNNNNNPNNSGNNGSNISDRPDPIVPEDPNYPSNDENDGSEEKPYIIYNAESFLTLLETYGTEGKNFTLDRDIDFSDKADFVTLFQDKAFNGHINGNEKAIKNLSINVNKDNFEKFITKDGEKYVSNVAVFGKTDGAIIENITFDNISINVADEIYDYIRSNEFNATYEGAFKQLSVASIAAIADNTKLSVNVNGTINGGAYSVYAENYVQGYNAFGGVVAVANKVQILRSDITVKMNVQNGDHYFVGGVAGYAYNSIIGESKVNAEISAKYNQVLYIGGVAGYILGTRLEGIEVNLTAKEADVNNKFSSTGVKVIADEDFTTVAGIVNVVRADNADQKSNIENVVTISNVDMDTVFAGAIMEVRTKAQVTSRFVTIKDVIVDANVNVLKAYGFAKTLIVASVNLSKALIDEANKCSYNVKLTGNVLLNTNSKMITASTFALNIYEDSKTGDLKIISEGFDIANGYETVQVVISGSIDSQVNNLDADRDFTKIVVA